MAAGAAFDAFVKSYLFEKLFGKTEDRFKCRTIFLNQVEAQNRDWAWIAGRDLFNFYRDSGALADFLLELEQATGSVRFEFTLEDRVAHTMDLDSEESSIPLLGKPDCYFTTKGGVAVVPDWKVNGFLGKRPTSPKKGYLKAYPDQKMHREAQPLNAGGIDFNAACYMEDIDSNWAEQLAIYGWLMGEPVGSGFIAGIDQICGHRAKLRCAKHRLKISRDFQYQVYGRAKHCWDTIQSGWIFSDLDREASDERCATLDLYHRAYEGEGGNEEWFWQITRQA
jgi:hypothetical protein